jgi:rSAM/selenodomain-associated transferase 1
MNRLYAKERLLVFTRYPRAGGVKTRLVPALGPEGAAQLQRRMTERTVQAARRLLRAGEGDVEVHYAGGDARSVQAWLGGGLLYRRQSRGDIGVRMQAAFRRTFAAGVTRAVLVGSDIPELDTEIFRRAFAALRRSDLVLGPARDGGYYLIGLTQPIPELFTGIPWSTGDVFRRTREIAQGLDLSVELVDILADVDRLEDLMAIEHLLR